MKTRDADIRSSLYDYLVKKFNYDKTTKIVHELNVCYGSARADVAAINGSLYGYEIKSDRDTLERLPQQVEFYSKVFDYINLVCSENFISEAEKIIPDWWGIFVASPDTVGSVTIDTYRTASCNMNIDAFSLAQFLWKDEVIQLLNELGADKKINRLPKYILWEELSKAFPLDVLKQRVRSSLKQRDSWKPD